MLDMAEDNKHTPQKQGKRAPRIGVAIPSHAQQCTGQKRQARTKRAKISRAALNQQK